MGIGVLPQKITHLSICLAAVQLVFGSLASVRCVDGLEVSCEGPWHPYVGCLG